MDGGGEGGGLHKINVNVDLPFNTCSSAASFVFHSYERELYLMRSVI